MFAKTYIIPVKLNRFRCDDDYTGHPNWHSSALWVKNHAFSTFKIFWPDHIQIDNCSLTFSPYDITSQNNTVKYCAGILCSSPAH